LSIIDLSDRIKKEFDTDYGVYIQNVSPYSEAFIRGLRAGIVIIEVNKEKVNNVSDFDDLVKDKKEGDVLVLKILLSNKEIRMVVLELK